MKKIVDGKRDNNDYNNDKSDLVEFKGEFPINIHKNEYKILEEFRLDSKTIGIGINEFNEVEGIIVTLDTNQNSSSQIRIPKSITNLNLKVFTIHNYKSDKKNLQPLIEIPEYLGQLQNLEDIHFDTIKNLPESIGKLKRLKDLRFSSNFREFSLPDSMGQLENLESLYITNTFFKRKKLPEWIGDLKNLESLILQNTQITALPESIGNLQKLTGINLNNNQIRELPKSFFRLKNLTSLEMNNNRLREIPEELGNLKNLVLLKLKSNNLNKLPESIGALKNLASLDISGNIDIDQLPKTLKTLENVDTICMRSTSIRSMCNINFIIDHRFDDDDIRQNRRTWIDGYDKDNFTKKGVRLYQLYDACGFNNLSRSNGDVENLGIYYSKSPMELALQLCDNPDPDLLSDFLSGDERERLIHEATWRERDVLEKVLEPLHPILIEINNEDRFKIKLKNGMILRK